jgi:hypothetical protein
MPRPVFISYSRKASLPHAQALAAKLGDLAFLDTSAIDDGEHFPQHLLDGILDASIVVIFATKAYAESNFCRLEMRLALAGGDTEASHLVLALGDERGAVLYAMPTAVAGPLPQTTSLRKQCRQRYPAISVANSAGRPATRRWRYTRTPRQRDPEGAREPLAYIPRTYPGRRTYRKHDRTGVYSCQRSSAS